MKFVFIQCVGFMECPVLYQDILEAYTVNRWDTGQHFCIRVTIPEGSVLLKVGFSVLTLFIVHGVLL